MNVIEDTKFSRAWAEVARSLPKPKAVLCISAHWEEPELAQNLGFGAIARMLHQTNVL